MTEPNISLNFVSQAGARLPGSMVGALGTSALLILLVLVTHFQVNAFWASLFVLGIVGMFLSFLEIGLNRVHCRSTAGLGHNACLTREGIVRSVYKGIGFGCVVVALGFLYWLIPEYEKPLYQPAFAVMGLLLPVILAIAIPYILYVDRKMSVPEDMYFKLGQFVCLKHPQISKSEWVGFLAGWGVKAFFLPIMLGFLCINMQNVCSHGFQFDSFQNFFITCMNFIFTLDTTFGAIGYLLTLRILDAHIREPDQTVSGWLVTLVCYPPFLSLMGQSVYHFQAHQDWQTFLVDIPILYVGWGTTILFCLGFYVWATVCFGCRFSNLTNRGIIDFGPYRFMKHPAYFFKCLSWWLLLTPFVCSPDPFVCLQASLLLALKCGIYYGRAKVEERLLFKDPAYRIYSQWIKENGWLAQISHLAGLNRRWDKAES